LQWAQNQHALTWKLLGEMEQPENFRVLFGKRKKKRYKMTNGDKKVDVYKRITRTLIPQLFVLDPAKITNWVKVKAEELIELYKKHSQKLQVTGGGINDKSDDDRQYVSDNPVEFLEFYISANGPDNETPERARNLWESITDAFPFFPRMHCI
ncbi:hypothetical protein FA95DRAFT_1469487, partial [Auriscalpium vulgare]